MIKLLDPKMDFIFKKIFGSEKHPNILISFLNAVIKPKYLITGVDIKNTDIEKESIEDKQSRLDIRAVTSNGEHINIEIQLRNEYNMIKRTLYYWGKMYTEQLNEGEDYSKLERSVCINLLNFKQLNTTDYHSVYEMRERYRNELLTDVEEIHFIEIPKLPDDASVKDMLVAWLKFLKNPESEEVRELELTKEEFKKAKDELVRISNDDKERALYEMREKANKDRNSALATAEEKGVQKGLKEGKMEGLKEGKIEGIKEGKIEIAKLSLQQRIDIKTISVITGLSVEEIEKLK